jgi:hypothetical protein
VAIRISVKVKHFALPQIHETLPPASAVSALRRVEAEILLEALSSPWRKSDSYQGMPSGMP